MISTFLNITFIKHQAVTPSYHLIIGFLKALKGTWQALYYNRPSSLFVFIILPFCGWFCGGGRKVAVRKISAGPTLLYIDSKTKQHIQTVLQTHLKIGENNNPTRDPKWKYNSKQTATSKLVKQLLILLYSKAFFLF